MYFQLLSCLVNPVGDMVKPQGVLLLTVNHDAKGVCHSPNYLSKSLAGLVLFPIRGVHLSGHDLSVTSDTSNCKERNQGACDRSYSRHDCCVQGVVVNTISNRDGPEHLHLPLTVDVASIQRTTRSQIEVHVELMI